MRRSRNSSPALSNTRSASKWSTFGAKQIWRMLHPDNGVSICGPCTCPRSKSSCAWSSQHWARSLHRPLCLQTEYGGSKICHTSALSSQCSLQRLAPRLVSTRHTLAQPAMASTASSSGKASSVKSKRYPGLPLLDPSVMVSRSAAAFLLPLQPATSTSLCQITPPRPRRALRQSRGASASSGLRLCVEDNLLQADVLPATQDDSSWIPWSLLQECQHVLSSDIKPYNKKLLGT